MNTVYLYQLENRGKNVHISVQSQFVGLFTWHSYKNCFKKTTKFVLSAGNSPLTLATSAINHAQCFILQPLVLWQVKKKIQPNKTKKNSGVEGCNWTECLRRWITKWCNKERNMHCHKISIDNLSKISWSWRQYQRNNVHSCLSARNMQKLLGRKYLLTKLLSHLTTDLF